MGGQVDGIRLRETRGSWQEIWWKQPCMTMTLDSTLNVGQPNAYIILFINFYTTILINHHLLKECLKSQYCK